MYPVLLEFQGITIYTYGFFVALALFASWALSLWRAKKLGVSQSVVSDCVFFLFVLGVVGARGFYVVQHFEEYSQDPLRIFSIPEGGLVWYGGFLSAFFFGTALAIYRKWPIFKLFDIFAPLIPLAHAIGRLGCYFNGCCFGRETSRWFGPRIPTQLLEAGCLALLSAFLFWLGSKKETEGRLLVFYAFFYGVIRFFIEFLRGDQRSLGIFTMPQWISLFLVIGSLILLVLLNKKRNGRIHA